MSGGSAGPSPERRGRVPAWLVYVVALVPVWAVITGSLHPAQLLLGLAVIGASVTLAWRFLGLPGRLDGGKLLLGLPRFAAYVVVVFLPDAVRAAVDMARRVILPVVPLRPGILAVPVPHLSELELLLVVEHVSLTPGQLVVEIDPDRGVLYVHSIDVSDPEELRRRLVRIVDRAREVG